MTTTTDEQQWRAKRKEIGLRIDPATAEVDWFMQELSDPYEINPLPPEEERCVGNVYFARAPGSADWIWFGDLPDATEDALWKRIRSGSLRKCDDDSWLDDGGGAASRETEPSAMTKKFSSETGRPLSETYPDGSIRIYPEVFSDHNAMDAVGVGGIVDHAEHMLRHTDPLDDMAVPVNMDDRAAVEECIRQNCPSAYRDEPELFRAFVDGVIEWWKACLDQEREHYAMYPDR
jgi:hypothetical protein